MRARHHTLILGTLLALPAAAHATGPTLTTLLTFNSVNGANPAAALFLDKLGNLYGSTTGGGGSIACNGFSCGLVFELSPPPKKSKIWTQTILYQFSQTDGAYPTAPLIADTAGNLYSTTHAGGASTNCPVGCGVIYQLSPPAAGQTAWSETILSSFNGTPGELPYGGLIADSSGNLYGTLADAGAHDFGNIFQLSPPATGKTLWKQTNLTTLTGVNGAYPFANLIADSSGNFYGTTYAGGASATCLGGCGSVFELSPPASGQTAYTLTTLFSFTAATGSGPQSSLIADSAGNLYGTTYAGGSAGYGSVFELSPPAKGKTAWTQSTLLAFAGATTGQGPTAGLIADSSGNLYGTTEYGGKYDDGTIFELTPPATGKTAWTPTVLFMFKGTNGANPITSLIADSTGNLYGTTANGGISTACETIGCGTVFKLTP